MLTVMFVLVAAAFLLTVISATGHCPLWAPMVLLCVIELLRILPIGR